MNIEDISDRALAQAVREWIAEPPSHAQWYASLAMNKVMRRAAEIEAAESPSRVDDRPRRRHEGA